MWSPGHEGKSDRAKKFHKQQQQQQTTENWARINLDSAEMEHIQQTSRLLNAGKIFTFLQHRTTFSHFIFDDNLDDTWPANWLPGHMLAINVEPGSIASRRSGNELVLLPRKHFKGRVDQTLESGGNRA